MSRTTVKDGVLRGCPVCGTPVAEAALGLRDYRWVNEALGNKLGLMDIDGVLSQAGTGRVLMLELKPRGARISTGARLTFALFVKAGFDCWVLWDQENGRVKLAELNDKGRPINFKDMTIKRAATLVKRWWDEGVED